MLMKDRFSKFHPLLHTAFFMLVFVFVLSINNPIYSAVSFVTALIYSARLNGKLFSSIRFSVAVLIFVSAFNMLFAHYGVTELFTIKDTRFTLEALFYGFNQGLVLCSVMLWFGAFSRIMDSEKVVYILRFTPKIALIFSMILGFVPRFTKKLEDIRDAQLGLNGGASSNKKFRQALDNFSALISYSLESSIITADSMTARGYNPRAVRGGRYKFRVDDFVLMAVIIAIAALVLVQKGAGNISFVFDPMIYSESFSISAICGFAVFQLLPIIIDLWEDALWKLSNAKS